ncbi:Threonine synthase [Candidatus Magnetaquicoccaceae bacterium FCR-1]|uniref:Threonine synthase n=1 Tax=Candidatus Magnetaquiglobus chichijimensis TaxID=3141448 RepID=A0ABQ0C4U3_9PROT
MRYISTRGGVAPISFSQAVMMGLATDGGLLLPERIPTVSAEQLRAWAGLSFQQLAIQVITPFLTPGEAVSDRLPELVERSFATFSHPDITPVTRAGDHWILELFHGPTLAFKDVALQFLGNLFEMLLKAEGGRLNILGATSGDTGSAAIHGVRGREGIHVFILHPHNRVSPIQERQMTSVLDANVHNIAIRGSFDDGQTIVKTLFNDLAFKDAYRLGAVNSINWARILAQIVYFFYAWGRVTGGDPHQKVLFSVPTGNFGDIFAGYMALRMGLPVERLILATNRNDILVRFMESGEYRTGEVNPTISPSMDIQISSNFERYLYYLLDEDPAAVRGEMERLRVEGVFAVSEARRRQAGEIFSARRVGEEETLARIQATWERHGVLLDPHTAVGVEAAGNEPGAICLATAHAAKFAEAVHRAVGFDPPVPPPLEGLLERPTRCRILDPDPEAVRAFIREVLG